MKDDFNSYALRGLADAVEDALQSDCTPDEILDCCLLYTSDAADDA